MQPWKKFRIVSTIFTGIAIMCIYTMNGMFSNKPIKTITGGLNNFYIAALNHCQVTNAEEIHYKAKRSHIFGFKVNCSDSMYTFLPKESMNTPSISISPGNFISKAANDYNFILTNSSGNVKLAMIQPNEASMPFHWEFPLIMGSFVVINFCIFFIFPKRYFESESAKK